jgi:hypothetical protein
MPPMSQRRTGASMHAQRSSRLVICMAIGLAALLCSFLSSCGKDVKTIWSTESDSPDGQWVAIAHTDQYGGPGAAGILSTVSLRQVKGRQGNIEIFQLSQDTTSVDLRLSWLTPSHLEITYRQPSSVDFQAVKCGGIDISVRDLSSPTSSTSAPQ